MVFEKKSGAKGFWCQRFHNRCIFTKILAQNVLFRDGYYSKRIVQGGEKALIPLSWDELAVSFKENFLKLKCPVVLGVESSLLTKP